MKRNGHKQIKTIRDLQPDSRNANKGTPRGLQMVEDSLRTYGAGRSILADKQGRIIAGNKTLQSASDIDLPIRVVETDGKELVVVQRTDLDLNSKKARELGIADNCSSQVGLERDADILSQLKDEGVELSGMFTEKELAQLLPQGESKDAEPQIDRAEELKQKWGTESGQLWEIGEHRLLVGDSRRKADVGRFCGGKVALVSADPPFGMGLFEHGGKIGLSKSYGEVKGDEDKTTALAIFEATSLLGRTQVWWGANHWGHSVISDSPCWLIWDKDHHGMTFADGEMAWTNIDSPVRMFRHAWSGADRDSEKGQERFHVNQKPAALFDWYFAFTTKKGDAILDPCCGVGGSMVAAENLNRTCYAMEISPEYCAVTLERMTTAFPNLKIEREAISRAA